LYSGSIKDQIKATQLSNCANKIISTCESVFYSGEPSKATITCYLPENLENVTILQEGLYFEIQLSTGIAKRLFPSNVDLIEGANSLGTGAGLRRVEITAEENQVRISKKI
jgi:hypothetical protein